MTRQVKVLLAGRFREIAEQREILENIGSATTLGDVLMTLAKRYGKDFNKIIDSKTGQISLENWVMVNGKSVRRIGVGLRENDVVTITVPAGGG